MAEMTQEEQMAQIKANCPFCKIVSGEYPSTKVYEDDVVLAVMDIRPAAKGQVLVMTKEHHPFLPTLPPETFAHVFKVARDLSGAVAKGSIAHGTQLYIASGQAAGQTVMHFYLYLIPRSEGDGLFMDSLPIGKVEPDKLAEAKKILSHNMKISLGKRFGTIEDTYNEEQLFSLMDQNPQVKEMILQNSDGFKEALPKNPQLSQVFKGIDVDAFIEKLKAREASGGGSS